MKNQIVFFFFLFVLTISREAFAQVYKTEGGNVEFFSKAPLNEFTGKSDKLNGLIDLEKNDLDFFIDLNTLKTGIGLRDRHMRENYLETKKYPFAEFVGKINEKVSLKSGESKDVIAVGTFKIHGVEKQIKVPGKITAISSNEIKLEASFKVLLSDYKIEIPKVVFYELAEEQTVSISTTLKK
ncbi:YceI family protein [Belliella sp. DSM 107340]|uniref:YceI family protein n=1 Tax=Belliella calami TaxID=2923436 RepID=A0ABS9URC2_9BACT|nr:YceI family protein [Belliella calami]MCH7399172.1 YceI family protein [Belliella calami]